MTLKDKLQRKKKSVRLDVRVPLPLNDRITALANAVGVSKSEIAREALERCLPDMQSELKPA
jgi:predicted DNA-binding protein